jgi:hypothetical protein
VCCREQSLRKVRKEMMLTLGGIKKATIRAVIVPLRRPVIADIGEFRTWPLILTDIELDNGLIGSSYIAPYRSHAVPPVVCNRDPGTRRAGLSFVTYG